MAETHKTSLVALRDRREQVIAALSEHFANDVLDLDEFDDRVGKAHRVSSITELEALVTDLEPVAESEDRQNLVPAPAASQALAVSRPDSKKLVAIFGGIERKGSWIVPQRLQVTAVFGGVELDFREVPLPPGVTEIRVTAVFGGVEIFVPPTLAVECEGIAVFGGFTEMDRSPVAPDPDAPLLRIHGVAVMGGVEIKTRLPGEGSFGAWRRRRRERRRERQEIGDGDRSRLRGRERPELPSGDD